MGRPFVAELPNHHYLNFDKYKFNSIFFIIIIILNTEKGRSEDLFAWLMGRRYMPI